MSAFGNSNLAMLQLQQDQRCCQANANSPQHVVMVSQLYGIKLAPLGKCSIALKIEIVPNILMTLVIEINEKAKTAC